MDRARAERDAARGVLTSGGQGVRARSLYRRLVLLVGCVCVAVWLSTLYDAMRDRTGTLAAAEQQDDNVAGALAEQAARALQATDLILQEAALLDPGAAATTADTRTISGLLRRYMSGVPQVRNLFLFDPARQLNVTASPPGTPARDVSDRSYFLAQRDRDVGLFVSEPIISRVTGQPTFVLSRRLPGPGFNGIAGAAVDVEYIRRFYHALDLGPESTIELLRADGLTLVSRESATVRSAPSRWLALLDRLAGVEMLHVRGFPGPGGRLLVSLRRVPGYPVMVVVARSERAVLAGWRTKTWSGVIRTLVITGLAMLLLIAFLRQLARHERVTAQLHQAQKLEALGTLAGGIAHDFNNILGAVLGYGELASQHAPPGSTQRRYLDHIIVAANRARELIARILAFSRPGVGGIARPLALQPLLTEVANLAGAVQPGGVGVELELRPGRLVTRGDPAQLHQMFVNLLTNAVQAVGAGGRVVLRAAAASIREARDCSVGRLRAGAYARIDILDSGPGMTAAQLERAFEPFFTTKPVGAGTGLGLSLVHGIVLDHDAALDIVSAPGAGTTVSVYLQLTDTEPLPEPVQPDSPRGAGETILVVDDEEGLVRLTEEVLAELGYEPVGCVGARAALRVFQSAPARFDAVLTDALMPGMSGTELVGELRRVRPDLRAIVVTGHPGSDLNTAARAAGAKAVLAKPLTSAALAHALAEIFGRAGAAADAA